MAESEEAVNALVGIPGIKDEPGEEGLTGFAIAIGLMNSKMATSILASNVEPREDIIFLAEEVLRVDPDGDIRISRLQNSIQRTLNNMGPIFGTPLKPGIDRANMWLEKASYPMINPEIEKEDRYFKNKIWQKENLRENLSESSVHNHIEADILKPLVLDKFCIESNTIVKWAVRDIKILPCAHEGDRYEYHV